MSLVIRSEVPSDVDAIDALIVAAFLHAPHASHTEQRIVHDLRWTARLTVSLVADDSGRIVGYVAVSPVSISSGETGWYGLGPIAVAPDCQRRGIGARLMVEALAELRRIGAAGCVVLGEPGYYGRFGFRAEPTLVLPGVPAEYFQAIAFGSDVPTGAVSYDQAFDAG